MQQARILKSRKSMAGIPNFKLVKFQNNCGFVFKINHERDYTIDHEIKKNEMRAYEIKSSIGNRNSGFDIYFKIHFHETFHATKDCIQDTLSSRARLA